MPCLVLMGHPCVGKSYVASKLSERALCHKSGSLTNVVIVNEENACIDRTKRECYLTSNDEKSTRASLKSLVDRVPSSSSSRTTLVIVDSMNYIKGYRYELHCLSRAAGRRHGVLWILNHPDVASEWNRKRSSMKKPSDDCYYYTEEQMEGLRMRFEPPDARNRWDRPLYRIDLTPPSHQPQQKQHPHQQKQSRTTTMTSTEAINRSAESALATSVYNMHSLSDAIHTEAAAAAPTPTPRNSKKTSSAFKKKKRPGGGTRSGGGGSNDPQATDVKSLPHDGNPERGERMAGTAEGGGGGGRSHAPDVPLRRTLEERLDDILDSFLSDEVVPLREGLSTRQNPMAHSDVLHDVDSLTMQICNSIASFQSTMPNNPTVSIMHNGGGDHDDNDEGGGGGSGGRGSPPLTLQTNRRIPLSELTRLRKQYVRWIAGHPPDDTSRRGIAASFVAYVQAQVQ